MSGGRFVQIAMPAVPDRHGWSLYALDEGGRVWAWTGKSWEALSMKREPIKDE